MLCCYIAISRINSQIIVFLHHERQIAHYFLVYFTAVHLLRGALISM